MASTENAVAGRQAEERTAKPVAGAARPFMASFLDHLVRNGIVPADLAHKAIEQKQQNVSDRRSLTEILQEEFKVPREVLQYQIAQFYAFRTVELSDRAPRKLTNPEALRLVKGLPDSVRALAMRHKILPYDVLDGQTDKLVVVTPNPSDREVTEVARSFPFKKFEICYMKEREWDEYFRSVSTDKSVPKPAPVIADTPLEVIEPDLDAVLDREITRAQLVPLVEKILNEAIKANASAIHVVPRSARKTDVEFRINGALTHWMSIEEVRGEAVAATFKARTPGMDRYERMAAQEGNIGKSIDGRPVHLRVTSMPVSLRDHPGKFELIIVQVNQESETPFTLETLGMPAVSVAAFREFLAVRGGMVLITGPVGSGRTSTLASLVRLATATNSSAIAIENAASWIINGVNHIRRTPKLNPASTLEMLERGDADTILAGELTDHDFASRALRLSLDGRRIFATMRAGDTSGAIIWLKKMGVDPYLIAHGLSIVHAQRLVRRLCPKCKTASTAEAGRLARFGIAAPTVTLYKSVGCAECHQGFEGRVPLHETLVMSPEVRGMIMREETVGEDQLRNAIRAGGGETLVENGAELVKSGATTLEEVWAVLS